MPEVLIYGDIGGGWSDEDMTAAKFVGQLSAAGNDDVAVRISSFGGSVSDGIAIGNAIKRNSADITTHIDSVAASIAALVAISGSRVVMARNALMMIHAPSAGTYGNAGDMRETADMLDKFAEAMITTHAEKTGQSYDEVKAWISDGKDHWFTAQEALDAGLVDEIEGDFDLSVLPIAAQFSFEKLKTVPAAAGIFSKPLNKEKPMPDNKGTQTPAAKKDPAANPPAPAAPTEAEIKAQVLAAENTRRTEVRAKFTPFMNVDGVDTVLAKCLDDSNIDVNAAVEQLHNKLGSGMEPSAGNFAARIETGESDNEKFARGVSQGMLARAGVEKHDANNEFRGLRLEDIARASLERSGRSVKGMDRMRMISAALAMRPSAAGGQTTSDFPVLMENVMHKQVLVAYQNAADTWRRFCKTGSVSDFREWLRLRTGSIGNLDGVNERGEYKTDTVPDAKKEGVSAARKGKIISITPEIIINDDIGYINDITAMMGRAAKRSIESEVYVQLALNAALKDGVALFHASHGNLAGSGSVPTIASIEAARVAMAKQKDIGDNDFLDIRPSIFVGGMSTGATARDLNAQEYNDESSKNQRKPNSVRGLFNDVVDSPRIAGNDWYLFADPAEAPVMEVVFLDGQDEPVVAMDENFTTAGVDYRVELPFGVSAIGSEGAYKNPGA